MSKPTIKELNFDNLRDVAGGRTISQMWGIDATEDEEALFATAQAHLERVAERNRNGQATDEDVYQAQCNHAKVQYMILWNHGKRNIPNPYEGVW